MTDWDNFVDSFRSARQLEADDALAYQEAQARRRELEVEKDRAAEKARKERVAQIMEELKGYTPEQVAAEYVDGPVNDVLELLPEEQPGSPFAGKTADELLAIARRLPAEAVTVPGTTFRVADDDE